MRCRRNWRWKKCSSQIATTEELNSTINITHVFRMWDSSNYHINYLKVGILLVANFSPRNFFLENKSNFYDSLVALHGRAKQQRCHKNATISHITELPFESSKIHGKSLEMHATRFLTANKSPGTRPGKITIPLLRDVLGWRHSNGERSKEPREELTAETEEDVERASPFPEDASTTWITGNILRE